jgi:succinate dehydrogenase/fumarate reductase flavoprotein subunit
MVNSRYALDQGAPRIDEEDFLRELARRNVIRHNPKRASYFVKNSGRIFDWAISIAGKEWMDKHCHLMSWPPKGDFLMEVSGWKFYHGCATFRNFDVDYEPWSEFLKMHQEKAMADGAKWFNEHHAEICDLDSTGAVTGVVAKRANGKYVRFRARKGVALCAGGFAGNREMVVDILDSVRHEAEARGDLDLIRSGAGMGSPRDGSGIKMGIWAGGHIEVGPHSTLTSGEPGCGVWYLQLDHNGERFCDEGAGTTLAQPMESPRVTLYDANWKQALVMMPPRHTAPDHAEPTEWEARMTHLDHIKPGPLSKENPQGQRGRRAMYGLPGVSGDTCCANTIEELFDYMDCYKGEIRKKALAEINRYNEMCEKGIDEDFGKDPRILKVTALKNPPFYATIETYSGSGMFGLGPGMSTTTGLDTDADGHVLDSNFRPIKGLYAAGNNAGGRFMIVYQSLIAGISIGMAMTEGFMLGERLADL